jgi:hypothetical protein
MPLLTLSLLLVPPLLMLMTVLKTLMTVMMPKTIQETLCQLISL